MTLLDELSDPDAPPTYIPIKGAEMSGDRVMRYTLVRVWDASKGLVCFIGCNPSTANAYKDDPTVKRWIHFTHLWGYGGFIAVNMIPLRSSDPDEARDWLVKYRKPWRFFCHPDMMHNSMHILYTVDKCELHVACWGNQPWLDPVTTTMLNWLFEHRRKLRLYSFGTTLNGSPKHPMARGEHRVPDDQNAVPWAKAKDWNATKKRTETHYRSRS